MMSLRQMEVFHAIMVTGSVTGAAKVLNVTQPAVSTVLKHCESQLKLKLFVRSSGRLQPTSEAQAMFPDIATIFDRLDAVNRLAHDLVGGRLGTLSIAAPFSIANGYLAQAVATFVTSRPDLRITLHSLSSTQVLDRIIAGEVAFGVAHAPVVNSAVETEALVRTNIGCVMPVDHPLAERSEIDIRDLEPYPILTYLPQVLTRSHVDRAFSNAGIAPRLNVQFGLGITGIMLARFGAGIALVEPFGITSMALTGVVVRPLRPRIELETLLVWRKDVAHSLAMNDFIVHLKKTVAEADLY